MIFILRNLSANNKNDLRQIMATGDVLLGLVLLLLLFLLLRIIMQISHGQRICKGRVESARLAALILVPLPVAVSPPSPICASPSLGCVFALAFV